MARWRLRHLVLSWFAYWAGLIVVTLSPLIPIVVRASQLPDGRANASLAFNNLVLKASVIIDGVPAYTGSAHFATLALWIAGPPLLLWAAWLRLGAGRAARRAHQVLIGEDAGRFTGAGAKAREDEPVAHRTPV